MEIKARVEGSVVVLELGGRVDANSANLIEVVGQCIHDGYLDVLCDFTEVEAVDYLGISAIILAYKEVINNQGRMKFFGIPAHLKNIFALTGLDRAVEIFAVEEIALNSFKEDKVIEGIQKMQLRRRFKRLPIEIKIELKDKYAKTDLCSGAEILNLSAVGAYIYGCSGYKLGDELMIKLKLPPSQEELDLEAKVVWLCDKQIQPQVFPGIGIEFRGMSNAVQEKIVQFIERNLSLSPTDDQ